MNGKNPINGNGFEILKRIARFIVGSAILTLVLNVITNFAFGANDSSQDLMASVGPHYSSNLNVIIKWHTIKGYDLETLRIAITDTNGFDEPLAIHKIKSPDMFAWEAPLEGVYHFRISQGAAAVRYGTFAIIDKGAPDQLFQLDWSHPKEDSHQFGYAPYIVKVVAEGSTPQFYRFSKSSIVLRRKLKPMMIEVTPSIPNSSESRGSQTLNAFLVMKDLARQDKPFKSPDNGVIKSVSLGSDESTTETLAYAASSPTEPRVGAEDNLDDASLPRWSLTAASSLAREEVSVAQQSQMRRNQNDQAGVQLGVRGRPINGLVMQFRGGIHRSSHAVTPSNLQIADETYVIDENRTHLDLAAGVDVLGLRGKVPHSLALKAGIAYREIPHVPLGDLGPLFSDVKAPSHRATLGGGGIDYTYHTQKRRFLIGVDSYTNKAKVLHSQAKLDMGIAMGKGLDFNLGAFASQSKGEFCNEPNSSACALTNTLKVREVGATVGIGASL